MELLYGVDEINNERDNERKALYISERCARHENMKEKVKRIKDAQSGYEICARSPSKHDRKASSLSPRFSIFPLPTLLPSKRALCKIPPRGNDGSSFARGNGNSFRSRELPS